MTKSRVNKLEGAFLLLKAHFFLEICETIFRNRLLKLVKATLVNPRIKITETELLIVSKYSLRNY